MRVVGADWAAKQWACVVLDDGVVAEVSAFKDIGAAVSQFSDALAIGVDIPIGLPEAPPRAADEAARKLIGGASVFPTYPRSVYECGTHQEAVALCRAHGWPGISRQSFGLWARIREVDPHADDVHEVHPEVSFWAMNGHRPLGASKHSWNGFFLRRQLLTDAGIHLPDRLDVALPIVDVLDAAAAAWSAHRIAVGEAVLLPESHSSGGPTISY